MCGIFASPSRGEVECALSDMHYRGPDAKVVRSANGFHVGFARLSIVATQEASASQPSYTSKQRIVAFNGELYNYQRLDSTAKAEVTVLGDMLDAGVDPRHMLDGDYAILYWNPSQRELTLYRDRFGVCQLYYQLHPYVAVSSEYRKLINPIEVPAFGRVRIDQAKRTARVDTLQHYGVTCDTHMSDDTFADLFLSAVESRATHSDGGFSQIVSGGLDSTAVAFAVRELGLRPRRTLIAVPEESQGDVRYAQLACGALGEPLTVVTVTKAMREASRPLIFEHMDGAHMSALRWRMAIRAWWVAQNAGSRVLLTGEGSDEVLEGYPPHTTSDRPSWHKARKQMTALRSLGHLNLDISHKLGLAHSVELRAPFLSSAFSYACLSAVRCFGKQRIRRLLKKWGCPSELLNRDKWSDSDRGFSDSYQEQ